MRNTFFSTLHLINDINYNNDVTYNNKEYKLQNLLVKANLITISIGMNDLIYKNKYSNITYSYADEILKDIEKLLIILRKYNKDKIYFIGYYNIMDTKDIIDYLNINIEKLCKKNRIMYIDISDANNYIDKDLRLNKNGYEYIRNKLYNFTK